MANTVFTFTSINPFGLTDTGTLTTPYFVDIDNDGDLDVFVGEGFGDTFFFRNTGTVTAPVFNAAIINPFGLKNAGFYIDSSYVDIDNDGDMDVFTGHSDGNVLFLRNTGTAAAPAFALAVTNPFGLSDVGLQSTPDFVDIDNDGDLDGFVGNSNGNIVFFRNTGTVNAPAFAAAVTNPFGFSDVGSNANPSFVDTDGDGDLDAFVGNLAGNTLFFKNSGTAANPLFDAPKMDWLGLSDAGFNASPVFADIDNDGDADAFVSERQGEIFFFLNDAQSVFLINSIGNDIQVGSVALQDTVSYASANAVKVSLAIATQQNTIGAGLDTLTNIENLVGGNFNDDLTGNFKKNVLNGGAGNDILRGGAGNDTMIGGEGNDIFVVSEVGDLVREYSVEGTDQINSSVTYALPLNVENLLLTGTQTINGTGNDLNNIITGNSAANSLNGNDGHDTINGREGADTMAGGAGFDSYTVDNIGDTVIENFDAGTDKISSSVTYALPLNVENLELTGTAVINGTGNNLSNSITGNSANNLLNGSDGNDILNGGRGTNTLTGGAGNDIFRFTTPGHVDTITDFNVADDTIEIENSLFTSLNTLGALAPDQFRIGAQAADPNDFIIYNSTTGVLIYDANGNGAGGTVQIAKIGLGLALTNADIVVI